jgi:nitrous oxide reductase accessory protein NosL
MELENQMKKHILAVIVLFGLTACTETSEKEEIDVPTKVALDMAEQYEMVLKSGDKMSICMHAGSTAQAFLNIKNEKEYLKWKGLQKEKCKGTIMEKKR